jgi:hypothetical protein
MPRLTSSAYSVPKIEYPEQNAAQLSSVTVEPAVDLVDKTLAVCESVQHPAYVYPPTVLGIEGPNVKGPAILPFAGK